MNKNVKKIFCVFVCVIMILSLFTVTSFSADAQKTTIEAELITDSIQPFSEFLVCISVKNASGLDSMDCDIRFDDEYLEFIRFEETAYAPGMVNYNYLGDGHAQFDLTRDNGSFTGSSELIYIRFKVYSDGEQTINININSWKGKNKPENATFSFHVGTPDNKPAPEGLTYDVVNNSIVITRCDENYKGRLDIPAEIDGYPVTEIASGTFSGCAEITSIYIPETVKKAEIGFIANYSALEKIIVAENNQYYSSDEHGVLFDKAKSKLLQYPVCNAATEYKIPDGVTTICESAFARAKKLTSIIIPDSVITIEAAAFLATWNLEGIVIPDSVTQLSGNAFSNSGIRFAVIPESIYALNPRVFDKCTKLESVILPAGITVVDDFAFSMCDKLAHVYYRGSKADWNNINVSDNDNSALLNAEIHYNSNSFVQFDTDGNGKITAADARLALRASASLETLSFFAKSAADIDVNGKITAADARQILRKAAGLE